MGQLSIPHLILLIIILLIFFGPNRLPQLGQSLGKAIRGFKEGLNEVNVDAKDVGPQQQIRQAENVVHQQPTPETKKENT
jgi:sec-independent protein translocase protein TatA